MNHNKKEFWRDTGVVCIAVPLFTKLRRGPCLHSGADFRIVMLISSFPFTSLSLFPTVIQPQNMRIWGQLTFAITENPSSEACSRLSTLGSVRFLKMVRRILTFEKLQLQKAVARNWPAFYWLICCTHQLNAPLNSPFALDPPLLSSRFSLNHCQTPTLYQLCKPN